MQVLVGDIGGTHARFALASKDRRAFQLKHFHKMKGDDYAAFPDAMAAYLQMVDAVPTNALLSVAGVVTGGDVHMTNRDWVVSAESLKDMFKFQTVRLVNDFAAMARSVPEIGAEGFRVIRIGQALEGAPLTVAGAGTGLGVATLLTNGAQRWRVISGEGGHCAFAAQTELEFELMRLLQAEHGYVSNELICSGMGMAKLHDGLCQLANVPYEDLVPQAVLDKAAQGDAICLNVCRIRARAIMSAAGDAVLTNAAWSGVVLAGGVSQHLHTYLMEVESLARFDERGPRTQFMRKVPIRILSDEKASLLGAAALFFNA